MQKDFLRIPRMMVLPCLSLSLIVGRPKIQETEKTQTKTRQTKMPSHKDANACAECKGVGLIKQHDVKLCTHCDGKKCVQCRETGISAMPYEECSSCHGSGNQAASITSH
jgi:hypothetical protein